MQAVGFLGMESGSYVSWLESFLHVGFFPQPPATSIRFAPIPLCKCGFGVDALGA